MTKLVNLKAIRERRGWSQQRLAYEADVSVDVIRKNEQGVSDDVYLSSVQGLAKALEVTIEELLSPASSHETLNSDVVSVSPDPDAPTQEVTRT